MSNIIQVLGLVDAVVAAIAVGAAIYYALNGREQLLYADPDDRRQRRRRSNELQPPVQRRANEVDVQNERDNGDSCRVCDRFIQNIEYDRTTLSCNHNFHCRCICDHFYRAATNENGIIQSTCPVCRAPYTIEDIQ